MNFKKYFETSEIEPRLIDTISIFYLIRVIGYTVDDLKQNYPTGLVIAGLLFHILAFATWLDQNKDSSYFGRFKDLVYKTLPFGLLIIYTTSIIVLTQYAELTNALYFNIITFMVTAIPMIMFYFSMGFNLSTFDFLKQKKKGTNNLFIAFMVLILIGLPVINK